MDQVSQMMLSPYDDSSHFWRSDKEGLGITEFFTSISKHQINVDDVLLRIFDFLQCDMRLLLSVSHTCRAWRERSQHLLQWNQLKKINPLGLKVKSGYVTRDHWLENAAQKKKEEDAVVGFTKRRLQKHKRSEHLGVTIFVMNYVFAIIFGAFGPLFSHGDADAEIATSMVVITTVFPYLMAHWVWGRVNMNIC
eukprot:PhF_6_TR15081/c0_g1_i3/m.23721